MKKYSVNINGIIFKPEASNRATAIRRALNSYYHDETASKEARKNRRRDSIGHTIVLDITRLM